MATPALEPSTSLQVRRTFSQPRPVVFEAWTKREKLEKWMSGAPRLATKYTEFDMRVGGTNRMEVRTPDGGVYFLRMTFDEIVPPEKLVFSWSWDHVPPSGASDESIEDTRVTVEFHKRGDATEVVLTHELFPTAQIRDRHEQGWIGCLAELENVLASQA
jgi:uncharacterized protein YndB with AHSA1/START domain